MSETQLKAARTAFKAHKDDERTRAKEQTLLDDMATLISRLTNHGSTAQAASWTKAIKEFRDHRDKEISAVNTLVETYPWLDDARPLAALDMKEIEKALMQIRKKHRLEVISDYLTDVFPELRRKVDETNKSLEGGEETPEERGKNMTYYGGKGRGRRT